MSKRINSCLIGIPDHQGVHHVGGRAGAARGPGAFRKAFARFKSQMQIQSVLKDLGDVGPITSQIQHNHTLATAKISEAHRHHDVSVVIGGGHDHGYSHLLGVAKGLTPHINLGCINLDAHLDVRKPDPLITSGSPFYLALENHVISPGNFIEFGIQPHCNAPALWEYAGRKKVEIVPFETLRFGKAASVFAKYLKKLTKTCDAIVISFDLDCVLESSAPGVSAPQSEGFSPSDIFEMMEIAGAEKKVISLGIFELNPEHDIADRTARLAATAAHHFLETAHQRD